MKSKVLISLIVGLGIFTLTGCGAKTTVTCTYNGQNVKYEVEKGKIVAAYNGDTKVSESDLEAMEMFASETNEETVEAIKDLWTSVGGTCK